MFKKLVGLTVMLLLFALPAFAIDIQEEGVSLGEITHINCVGTGLTATNAAGGVATLTTTDVCAENEESIQFTPGDFTLSDAAEELTAGTAPNLVFHNDSTAIEWADAEVTPVQVTFRVPADYYSGGAFRAFCDSDAVTTPSQVDFDVYINKDNVAWDAAAQDQTPVALVRGAGTPEIVTLSVATDFASLVAGDVITINVWRDNTATGTDNLELYWLDFYYNSVQNN